MSKPSQLDIFRATVLHQPHGHFLFYAEYTPSVLEGMKKATGLEDAGAIARHYGLFTPSWIWPTPPSESKRRDFSRYFDGVEMPQGSFINNLGVLEIPGSSYHFTRYVSPLRNAASLADVEDFPFVSLEGYSADNMAAAVELAHKNGQVTISWIGHMYEDSWQIRGYEEFLMDMLTAPEICEFILDRVAENVMWNAVSAAKAGVDMLRSGDDVASQKAMMFDVPVWRKFIKSRWARIYEAARAIKPDIQIWYHSDGNIEDIIPELIDIGVTILNPIQPECMDMVKLKREYGKHLVFDGCIGTQTTMPFGTPDDVRRVVAEAKKSVGYDGALILSPTHVLEPEVPVENVLAFFEAAGEV